MPPKPFLRKRSGISGRLMEKIHYPTSIKAAEKQLISSNAPSSSSIHDSSNGAQDLNRPITAGTADSGCPEDSSVLLSPNSNRENDGIVSVVKDITDCSSSNSTVCCEVESNHGVMSVIQDLSSFSTNEVNIASTSWRNFADYQEVAANTSIREGGPQVSDVISPDGSENSQDTDDTRSRHWREVVREFASEAKQKLDMHHPESVSANGKSLSSVDSNGSEQFPYFVNLRKRPQKEQIVSETRRKPHTAQLSSSEKPEDGIYASVKKVGNKTEKMNTVLLEKSTENLDSSHILEGKGTKQGAHSNIVERNLAKQLRDLIAHVDLAMDLRHHEYERFEEIFDQALQEKEYFRQQAKELEKRVLQLEENKQTRHEKPVACEETEKRRNVDINSLKHENAILNHQKQKDRNDTLVNLLKEQINDLRLMVQDFDRQRSELRMQIRKINAVLKEKNEVIEQLKGEKACLEKRIAIITKNKAAVRGRLAEHSLSAQAVARASKNAAVTTSTKDLTPQNNGFHVTNAIDGGRRINQINNTSNKTQNPANIIENTDTLSDNEDVVGQEITPARLGKNVRWNDPLATMASFSPPLAANSGSLPNSDMHLILTENNTVGKASLYRSEIDFTVYTVTHCGCHFYEYSNTDTRWIHASKLYQVNYYGQAGATTVEMFQGKLLVRHFLTGQLEIYREGGETTLVTPDGRRLEVVRDKSGSVRVEIYELDGRVRVRGRGDPETKHWATQTSCHRMDGSYASHIVSDDSIEWRSPDYAVHRFKNGDTKVRLNLIDTSITMLVRDVGTVKHLSNPLDRRFPKYCVEWGTFARKKSRVIAATQSRVLDQL